eukprot:7053703-Prymnesium_polylepis.1
MVAGPGPGSASTSYFSKQYPPTLQPDQLGRPSLYPPTLSTSVTIHVRLTYLRAGFRITRPLASKRSSAGRVGWGSVTAA